MWAERLDYRRMNLLQVLGDQRGGIPEAPEAPRKAGAFSARAFSARETPSGTLRKAGLKWHSLPMATGIQHAPACSLSSAVVAVCRSGFESHASKRGDVC